MKFVLIFGSRVGVSTPSARAASEGLQHPRHVLAQRAHDLQALFVALDVLRATAVHHGPVIRRRQGHAVVLEILVDLIDRRRGARAARAGDGSGGLEPQLGTGGHEHAVEQRQKRAVGSGVKHRRSHHDAVGGFRLLDDAVGHVVVEHAATLSLARARAAAQATAHRVAPDQANSQPMPSASSASATSRSAVYVQRSLFGLPLISKTFIRALSDAVERRPLVAALFNKHSAMGRFPEKTRSFPHAAKQHRG